MRGGCTPCKNLELVEFRIRLIWAFRAGLTVLFGDFEESRARLRRAVEGRQGELWEALKRETERIQPLFLHFRKSAACKRIGCLSKI
jgi:hypothetical protein